MDRGQEGINQRVLLCHFCPFVICRFARHPFARYQAAPPALLLLHSREFVVAVVLFLPSLHSYFPCPDSDTLDFSRSRDLFEESRESFDASAYDGREFPFGGRTIPVKNCSRNAEAVIPAIFIPFPFVPRVYASACVHFFFFFLGIRVISSESTLDDSGVRVFRIIYP